MTKTKDKEFIDSKEERDWMRRKEGETERREELGDEEKEWAKRKTIESIDFTGTEQNI